MQIVTTSATLFEISTRDLKSYSKTPSFAEIHRQAVAVAQNIKSDYAKLFEILLEVESRQIYQQFEVTSLYLYCVELLELSPSIANDFINVVRKSLEIPQLAVAVRSQKLTISKARKICSVMDFKNYREWIDLAATCSCRVVEKAVAMANPRAAVGETAKYISEDTLEFKMAVSEEWIALLKKTKDLLSQQKQRAVSAEEAIFILMSEYSRKNDPVEKAKRAEAKTKSAEVKINRAGVKAAPMTLNDKQGEGRLTLKMRSRYRPALVEHAVNLRDQRRCTYVDSRGKRCEAKRWLQKHHVRQFANGGEHSVDNLQTLCSAHHKIRHLNELVT